MSSGDQIYGAGIWHFATYVDRYATDGYGTPRTVIDAINLAGQVADLSVVDLNYPFFGGDFTNDEVRAGPRPQRSRASSASRRRSTPGSSPRARSPIRIPAYAGWPTI